MKVKVICEKCDSEAELAPETIGMLSNVHKKLEENGFQVFDVDIENQVDSSPSDEFLSELAQAKNGEKIQEILDNELDVNVDVESKLNNIRIDCKKCGNYIVLEEFN